MNKIILMLLLGIVSADATLILGYKTEDKIYLLGDRASVDTQTYSSNISATPKIIRRDDIMIGSTGTFGLISELKHVDYPTVVPLGMDEEEFLQQRLLPALFSTIKGNYAKEHPAFKGSHDVIVVAVKDRLFAVTGEGDIWEAATNPITGVTAVAAGCGVATAMPALNTLVYESGLSGEEAVVKAAIMTTIIQNGGVSFPLDLMTRDLVTEEVESKEFKSDPYRVLTSK